MKITQRVFLGMVFIDESRFAVCIIVFAKFEFELRVTLTPNFEPNAAIAVYSTTTSSLPLNSKIFVFYSDVFLSNLSSRTFC